MPFSSFSTLPPSARIWIFSSNRELLPTESAMLMSEIGAFLQNWTAHKVETLASADLRYNRFLIIAADENVAKPGGCSIDEMMRRVRILGETYGVEFIGAPRVEYRNNDGAIVSVARSAFGALAENKEIDGKTVVFDNTITTKSELRDKWEVPASQSWHNRAFELA